MNRISLHLLLLVGLLPLAACWSEFAYRIALYRDYGSKPFANHVADGYFSNMYAAAGVALCLLVTGLVIAIRRRTKLTAGIHMLGVLAATAYVAALTIAHHQAAIVTYSEFIASFGP